LTRLRASFLWAFSCWKKDKPILLAAMEARATHLITGDVQHFGPCFGKRIEGILILTPADYLKNLRPR
jgi:uncharacterized protein